MPVIVKITCASQSGKRMASTSGRNRWRFSPRRSAAWLIRKENQWKLSKTVEVGGHPCAMVLSPKIQGAEYTFLYVANANSDTVSVVRTGDDKVIESISCRTEARLPFGSGCNALAIDPM